MSDPINPDHYRTEGIECIDAMRAAFGDEALASFCKLNAFKYMWRAESKGGYEDLSKASWYLQMASGSDPRDYRNPPLVDAAKDADYRRLELFEAAARQHDPAACAVIDDQVAKALSRTK